MQSTQEFFFFLVLFLVGSPSLKTPSVNIGGGIWPVIMHRNNQRKAKKICTTLLPKSLLGIKHLTPPFFVLFWGKQKEKKKVNNTFAFCLGLGLSSCLSAYLSVSLLVFVSLSVSLQSSIAFFSLCISFVFSFASVWRLLQTTMFFLNDEQM